MNYYLGGAALVALATFLTHLVLGGRYVARPLLDCHGLRPVARFTAYYCWHIVTWMLAVMAALYAGAAAIPGQWVAALAATALAAGCLGWSAGLIVWRRLRPAHYPQWAFFSAMTVLGTLGLWHGR